MPTRDIIVIGASAGGVQALERLVSRLPANLPAAIFVALHLPPYWATSIDKILSRAGRLPAFLAWDEAAIEHGRILIAPPNQHLLISRGHVHLTSGPKENRQRPAINVLFRSAAETYRERVIGVVLTGFLDDGTAGLWEIKRRGGLAVVQDTSEAEFPDMAENALKQVPVDYTATLQQIGASLAHWSEPTWEPKPIDERSGRMQPKPTNLTCPECRGPLEDIGDGVVQEFKCRVGHRYSGSGLLTAHVETEERTLWAAVVALEEGAEMAEKLAGEMPEQESLALLRQAQLRRKGAIDIRKTVECIMKPSVEISDIA